MSKIIIFFETSYYLETQYIIFFIVEVIMDIFKPLNISPVRTINALQSSKLKN